MSDRLPRTLADLVAMLRQEDLARRRALLAEVRRIEKRWGLGRYKP